jgi:hypothetical protein
MVAARPFRLSLLCLVACAESTPAGPPGPQGPPGPPGSTGPTGPTGDSDPSRVIVNGTAPQMASFNITGAGVIAGKLTVGDTVHSTLPWGLTARTQGLMVIPEGAVYDDGAGTLVLTSTLIIMNPAAGSWLRVAAGSYALPVWGYLYVDLPSVTAPRSTVTPGVGSWRDSDRPFDSGERFVLAQRMSEGAIFLNFRLPVPAAIAPSSLVTMIGPNLGDVRNNASTSAPQTWYTLPNRTLGFIKRFATSKLRVTYQDTLGSAGQYFQGCEWHVLLDGSEIGFFSDADLDRPAITWMMHNAAHVMWAQGAVGSHTIVVQNRGNRGAWTSGTIECLQGWNTTNNFLSVEEIP